MTEAAPRRRELCEHLCNNMQFTIGVVENLTDAYGCDCVSPKLAVPPAFNDSVRGICYKLSSIPVDQSMNTLDIFNSSCSSFLVDQPLSDSKVQRMSCSCAARNRFPFD